VAKALDLITIGRSSVDLYGDQIGGRLEDMASFSKYIGGSPTNIAAGTARLGLRSAVITAVGDEHMGRFIREQLIREGVDVRGVKTDPERLSALVLLGIRDQEQFPLIFYRENCADMALSEADIDPAFIADGAKTALDIDYRPNLWGLAGHGDGENRFIESAAVTAKLQATLPLFDLIVRCWCANAGRWAQRPLSGRSLRRWMKVSLAPAFPSRCLTSWGPGMGLCPVY